MALDPDDGYTEEPKNRQQPPQYPYTRYNDKVELSAGTEQLQGCIDMGPRNRRADIRMSDIHRAVDKAVPDSPKVIGCGSTTQPPACGGFGNMKADPELLRLLDKAKKSTGKTLEIVPLKEGYDLNTPSSLKQLRWEIYDLIERYEGNYGRTISMTLRSKIEDLFKKYTHS